MLHPERGRSANRNTTKLAVAAAAMTLLSGCAMAMPLRPLATSSQDSRDRDFYCRADPKCSHRGAARRIAYQRSQPVDGGQIHDPPDFNLKAANRRARCASPIRVGPSSANLSDVLRTQVSTSTGNLHGRPHERILWMLGRLRPQALRKRNEVPIERALLRRALGAMVSGDINVPSGPMGEGGRL